MSNILLLLELALVMCFIKILFDEVKAHKLFTSLRMNPGELPLSSEQPLPLIILCGKQTPPVLIKQLSRGTHLILIALWFAMSVVITLLAFFSPGASPSDNLIIWGELLGGWSACWVVVQGTVTLVFSQRIEASESGLLVQRGVIRRRISWDQARLFAMDSTKLRGPLLSQYELSGMQQIVRWESENTRRPISLMTLKPATPEYQQELVRLRSYIREKTALPLRELRSLRT